MVDQLSVNDFNQIYDDTYNIVLQHIICKCSNMNDVNDIIQETYLQLYQILSKKVLNNQNIKSYVLQIATHKIKKHYSFSYRLNRLFVKNDSENLINNIKDDVNIEELIINQSGYKEIWDFIKKKDLVISKIFFLKFNLELTIKEIGVELNVSESYVKNCLYRTIKEIKITFEEEQ